jgi:hypothetical protein
MKDYNLNLVINACLAHKLSDGHVIHDYYYDLCVINVIQYNTPMAYWQHSISCNTTTNLIDIHIESNHNNSLVLQEYYF